ncbi:protein kinase domain-containing protein [Solimonas flava]|uniref:protein kinase domain-containing protein n=1 Tax=Solimonas flava TaxID=415849 RepID=UPI000406ACC6|nr:tetratricopeptide repeat protein [Solimonas flava]
MDAAIPEANLQPARWRFGDAELDEFRLEVVRGGRTVAVEPKSLELLRLFVRHPGEVLTKDELMEAVWPGRVLSESVLARAISLLRRAIGDGSQSVIRTVHGYGYRFDVAVERLTPVRSQSPAALPLQPGGQPPLRPNWKLVERLGEGRNETWLVEHGKTRERRVFKFAGDGAGLSTLKREITLQRLLTESLGARSALVPLLDWNLQQAPYFIETEWCPAGSLEAWLGAHPGIGQEIRLELVAQAAEALAAAHTVGVLHKDVKPANLLIVETGGRPAIRLADFGSGALIDDTRLQALSITRLGLTRDIRGGEPSGSLMYLAPEVIAGQPATLRSDVYALGVLLYQLIVGDLRRPLAPGWERDIADPLLREDIAAAAELDPARRLADAGQLAGRLRAIDGRRLQLELDRAEAQRAAHARRQIERWRARRGWVFAASGALALGMALSTGLYLAARQARDQARQAEASASAVNQFLLDDLLAATDPQLSGRPDITVRELLSIAAERVGARFAAQPLAEARVRRTLGSALDGLGEADAAGQQFQAAQVLVEAHAAEQPRLAAQVYLGLASRLRADEQLAPAQEALHEALALARSSRSPELELEARLELAKFGPPASTLETTLSELETLHDEAKSRLAADHPLQLKILRSRATTLCDLGLIEDCERSSAEALALSLRFYPATHPEALISRYVAGSALLLSGRYAEARAKLESLWADARLALGAQHQISLLVAQALGIVMDYQNDDRAALALIEQTLAEQIRVLGPRHTDVQSTRNALASLYSDLGRVAEAAALYRDVYAVQVAKFGAGESYSLIAAQNYGRMLQDLNRWDDALEVQRQLHAAARGALPPDHWLNAVVEYSLARTLGRLGQHDEAERLFATSIARLRRLPDVDPRYLQRALQLQAEWQADRSLPTPPRKMTARA